MSKKSKVRKSFDPRMRKFWEYNLNPITGIRHKPSTLNLGSPLEYEKNEYDQMTLFKPKGFR